MFHCAQCTSKGNGHMMKGTCQHDVDEGREAKSVCAFGPNTENGGDASGISKTVHFALTAYSVNSSR